MKFSANFPVEISGCATPLAAEAWKSCAAGMTGGMEAAGSHVQNLTSARSNNEQLAR